MKKSLSVCINIVEVSFMFVRRASTIIGYGTANGRKKFCTITLVALIISIRNEHIVELQL